MFKVKALDYTFISFDDYNTAFKVAVRIRAAYKKENPRTMGNVFRRQDDPGFMIAN